MHALILSLALAMTGTPLMAQGAALAPVDPDSTLHPADELMLQANGLFDQPEAWPRLARLFERSAELRDADDPKAAAAYRAAGRIQVHLRDLTSAERNFEAAAEAAIQIGAVAEAAGAYLDAAQVAIFRKDLQAAREYVRKGELLIGSPHLSTAMRESLARRVPPAAALG